MKNLALNLEMVDADIARSLSEKSYAGNFMNLEEVLTLIVEKSMAIANGRNWGMKNPKTIRNVRFEDEGVYLSLVARGFKVKKSRRRYYTIEW